MLDTGLKNKVVLITGANHGIGAATAKAFANEGAKVFISYLRISPDDIANAIVFFASQQADWITGQLLYVGGGHQMPL